jgi:hypothetical protein
MIFIAPFAHAQESASWKVSLGKKNILTGNAEDTSKNIISLKKADLTNNGMFRIEYTEPKNSATKGWVRTIALMDTTSAVVAQRDSTSELRFYNKDMLKILWSRKKVTLYTWAAPADPAMAAAIRIRRQHLCTIVLAD